MATARVEFVQPEPPPKKVILELTEEEAAAVYALVGNVEGEGDGRKASSRVWEALRPHFDPPRWPPPLEGKYAWKSRAELTKLK